MAKLTGHGSEIIRLQRDHVLAEHDAGDGTTYHYTLAFMSDGSVLEKIGYTHVSEFTGRTTREGGNWKRAIFHGKPASFSKLLAAQGEHAARQAIIAGYVSQGWRVAA